MRPSSSGGDLSRMTFRSEKQVSLVFVYLTVFVDIMGESLVLPILGQFAVYFGQPVALAGLLFSSTALAMTCSNLWLPVFADRHGRRAAFLVSLVGSTVGYAGQACARTFAEMLFFRGIQGLFGGVPPVALAWVTDVFPPNERPRYLAGVQATIASAFVAGAVLGGTLSSFGLRAPMCFACAVSLLGLATAHHYLKDPADLVFEDEQRFLDGKDREDERARARSDDAADAATEATPLGGGAQTDASPWRRPRCLACGLLSFSCNVAYGGASVLLPLFVLTSYGDLPREAAGQVSGLLFGALGLAQAAVMAGGFAPVSARLGLMPTCAIAALALGAGVGGIPLVGNRCASPWALLAPLALVALGNGLSRPAYVTYLSKIASKKYVSQTMAIVDVTLNAAMVCGPQLTVVFEKDGAGPAFLVAAAAAACELGVALAVARADAADGASRASLLAASGGGRRERAADPPPRPRDVFLSETAKHLEAVLLGRNYEVDTYRAQVCVREILDGAFPYLAPGGTESPAHMRDVGRLMASLGHDDWAQDVQDKFQFEPMRRRPKTRFSHDIQGRESSRGALC